MRRNLKELSYRRQERLLQTDSPMTEIYLCGAISRFNATKLMLQWKVELVSAFTQDFLNLLRKIS